MNEQKIKILVVDDSQVSRTLMSHLLSMNPVFEVVGTAENGEEALEFIKKNPPDLVFTDIVMPKMNGFELTKKIMEIHPLPVIVVSGIYSREEIQKGFNAIEAGALSILEKPKGLNDAQFSETIRFIGDTLKIMLKMATEKKSIPLPTKPQMPEEINKRAEPIEAIAIGASLGGPRYLRSILSEIPPNIKSPIFIVQHISPGFVEGLVDWLKTYSKIPVELASNYKRIEPGHVYIAPDGFHMEVNEAGTISLVRDSQAIYVPSAGRLFRSIAQVYGNKSLGIMLMGSSKDGVEDLKLMKQKGALVVSERGEGGLEGDQPATVESILHLLKGLAAQHSV